MKVKVRSLLAIKELKKRFLTFMKKRKDTFIQLSIVFFLPVLLYMQTLSYGFTYFDDNDIILNNVQFLSDFDNAPQAFLKNAIMGEGEHLYRPLQTLSYMTDISLSGGNNAWMFHLTNVLLLGFIAGLLFLLLRKFLIPITLAVLSTLLYCVHPLFTSSIAWIPSRGDLLLTFFTLLSFLFLIEYLQKRKNIYLFLHWIAFTIALFCKETSVTLPLLFIAYYIAFSSEKRFEKKFLFIILLYAISGALWFWLRSIAIGNISIQNEVSFAPLISNLQMIPESLATFFLPFDIDLFPSFSLLKTLTGLGIIIVIISLFFSNKEGSKKKILFCLLWFLLLILPTTLYKIKFIDYLNHRFFLPLIGVLLFVIFIIPKSWLEIKYSRSSWLLVAIIVMLSSMTFIKSKAYVSPIKFFNTAIAQNPTNALMYNNRGYVKVDSGDFQEAIDDYTKAIELNPNFALFYYNRGNAYSALSNFEKAIKDYDKVIVLNPKSGDAYNNRGIAYKNRGSAYSNRSDFDKAILDFSKVIGLNHNDVDAYNNRGSAYYEKGDYEMAIKDYDKAIAMNPYYALAYFNRGTAYNSMNLLDKAEQDFIKYEELTANK